MKEILTKIEEGVEVKVHQCAGTVKTATICVMWSKRRS